MAETIKGLTIRINGDVGGLQSAIAQAERSAGSLQKSLEKVGKKVTNLGKSITRNVTVPIVAGFTAAIKTTADFDSSMSKVQAVTGATGDDMDALRKTARAMGEQTMFSASQSADAMYYMGLAGWTTEEIIAGIPGVLDLAAASGEDLSRVSDIVTDSMTAFGLEADQTGHYVDVLAQTSRRSNTTIDLLGESFKYAAPVAGALGFNVEDVAIALGLMADNGIKGSMAGTALRNIFQRMAKPTKESADAMDALNLSLYDANGNMYSFKDIMDQLRRSMGGLNVPLDTFNAQIENLTAQLDAGEITEEEYQKGLEDLAEASYGAGAAEKVRYAAMLAGARGMPGLLAIVNATDEEYNGLANSIYNSAGAAGEMAEVMRSNLNGQLTILLSKLQELAISFGDLIMPYLMQAVSWLQSVVDRLNQLTPQEQEQIIKIAAIAAAVGPLLIVIGKLISGLSGIIGFGKILISGIGFLLSPIGLIVAAVALLAAGFIHLYKTNDEFRDKVTAAWESIKLTGQQLWDTLKPIAEAIVQYLTVAIPAAVEMISGIMLAFAGMFSGDFEMFLEGLNTIMDNFMKLFGLDWEAIKTWMQDAMEALYSAGERIVLFFSVTIPMKFEEFKKKVEEIIDGLKTSAEEKFELIKTTVTTKVQDLRDAVVAKFQEIRSQFGIKIDGLKNDAVVKWNAIKSTISEKLEAIKGLFNFEWHLPDIKTPHFKVNAKAHKVLGVWLPSISVDWYKKAYDNPYLFTRPTVMGGRGFGDGGGSGEIVYGRDQLMRDIAAASTGSITVNVYGTDGMNVNQLADAVQDRLLQLQRQREMAYA